MTALALTGRSAPLANGLGLRNRNRTIISDVRTVAIWGGFRVREQKLPFEHS